MGSGRLRRACTTAEMVAACHEILGAQRAVSIEPEQIAVLASLVAGAPPIRRRPIRLDSDDRPRAIARDILLYAGQSGGFWSVDSSSTATKWQRAGSGTEAMLDWLRTLAARGRLPCHDGPPDGRKLSVDDVPAAAPYRLERGAALRECVADGALDLAVDIFGGVENRPATYDLARADRLATAFPINFGGDAFRKKAILALFVARVLLFSGQRPAMDLPVAADYQLPRILMEHDVIRLNETAMTHLARPHVLLEESAPLVESLRAATVVVGHDLAVLCGLAADEIDSALLSAFVKPGTSAIRCPAIRCATFWF